MHELHLSTQIMATAQIRINKNSQIEKLLTSLKRHYVLLSDAEIVKVALSKLAQSEETADEKFERELHEACEESKDIPKSKWCNI